MSQDLIGIIIVIAFVVLMVGVAIYSKSKRRKAAEKTGTVESKPKV